MSARYAIYYLPERDSPLGQFGKAWLGWDVWDAKEVPLTPLPGFDQSERAAITATPRRYGFHATLKAPMKLAPQADLGEILEEAESFTTTRPPIKGIRLKVSSIGSFLAIKPAQPIDALNRLAADCVTVFDKFRAPLEPQDRARRRPDTLTERQCTYLDRWGYPFVLEEFRFHLTLTGALPPDIQKQAQQPLKAMLEQILSKPLTIASIAIAVQETPDAAFRALRHFPLSGPARG